MKGFFRQLFDDRNTINEKAVVGFIAFFCLVIAFIANIISGFLGNPIVLNKFIFDGFMVLVLGCFGIASVDKWMNKKDESEDKPE